MTSRETWTKNVTKMSENWNQLESRTLIVFSRGHRTVNGASSEIPVDLDDSDFDLSFDFFCRRHLYDVFVFLCEIKNNLTLEVSDRFTQSKRN